MLLKKDLNRKKRIRKVRAKISGTASKPRLAVFRSLKHIYAQLIDDEHSLTLVATSDLELKSKKGRRVDQAFEIGQKLANKATKEKIKEVVFDKRGYKYHGIVKDLAEGARKGGLKF
jgi:large subunit ribosomal protein L18